MFHELHTDIAPPERFTWPFCYDPHPLCVAAAERLQARLASVSEWREEISAGKMFGVLVVLDAGGATGYLAAYSGQLCGCNDLPGFVPAVYDMLQPDGHFKTRESEITALNRMITDIENDAGLAGWRQRVADIKARAENEINGYKQRMAEAKALRDEVRARGAADESVLIRESQFMKAELRRMKQSYSALLADAEARVVEYDDRISLLKRRRRQMSDELQRWIFSRFRMLNALGEEKDLNDIFAGFRASTGCGTSVPPSGAGECCAPKLLQYAYANGYKPLCMAEFWYGASPRTTVRRHLHYYPACRSKCRPILLHMLRGLVTDPDPLAASAELSKSRLTVVYEDEYIAVVDKPSGMLSVPGATDRPSVAAVMGQLPVHRLDMDTSGLLMLAKTVQAQRIFRAMFERRHIQKRYMALLDGIVPQDTGEISLPLSPDYSDRPRQKVDYDNGRPAVTRYEVIERRSGRTLVALYPLTGRTHQLRVHCSHCDGLDAPIVGDRLYGTSAPRLCLHAERLKFRHPIFDRQITILSEYNENSNSQKTPWPAFSDRS